MKSELSRPKPKLSQEREIVGLASLSKQQQVELAIAKVTRQKELADYRKYIFEALLEVAANELTDLKICSAAEHVIEIKPGTEPIRQANRPVPHYVKAEYKETIEKMLRAGLIRPSKSPWNSPSHLVKKKIDGFNESRKTSASSKASL